MIQRIKYLLNNAGFQGYLLFGLLFFLPAASFFMSKVTNIYPLAPLLGYCLALVTSRLIIMYYKHSMKFFNTIVVTFGLYTVYASLTGKNALKDLIYNNENFFYVILTILVIFGYILMGKLIILSQKGIKTSETESGKK